MIRDKALRVNWYCFICFEFNYYIINRRASIVCNVHGHSGTLYIRHTDTHKVKKYCPWKWETESEWNRKICLAHASSLSRYFHCRFHLFIRVATAMALYRIIRREQYFAQILRVSDAFRFELKQKTVFSPQIHSYWTTIVWVYVLLMLNTTSKNGEIMNYIQLYNGLSFYGIVAQAKMIGCGLSAHSLKTDQMKLSHVQNGRSNKSRSRAKW